MSEEFGNDYLTIEDEEGNTFELEVLGGFDFEDRAYMAALPADMEETDPDFGIILLRIEEEDGEELFASIDDDDELDRVYEYYMQSILEDEEPEA
ncbi:MAG: DUF1292 domain-containing protein [Oscillospiraceae bacterium]|nr:DUF1292 domain-containing protein [Oscillospiraceae bacterium]